MNNLIETIGQRTVISVINKIENNDNAFDDKRYEYKMITGNSIPVFLSCKSRYEDGKEIIEYDISSKRSIESISESNKLCFSELIMLILSLKEARLAIGEYLLSPEGLILDPKLIFYDSDTKRIRYCFYPWEEKDVFTSYSEISEFLLSAIDYEDEKAVSLAYKIYAAVLNKNYVFETLVENEDDLCLYNKESPETQARQSIQETRYYSSENLQYVNKNNRYPSETSQHPEERFDLPTKKYRLSTLSVICLTLFATFSGALILLYTLQKKLFLYMINNSVTISVLSAVMCILIFIPVTNIGDIRRLKRQDVHVQKTCEQ